MNRREFLLLGTLAGTSVTCNAVGTVDRDHTADDLPFLGKNWREWARLIDAQIPEASHVVNALSTYRRDAVILAVSNMQQACGPLAFHRVRRLVQVAAEHDPGITGRILDLVETNESWRVDCYALLSQFVERIESVADAFSDAATTADPYSAAFFLEPLIDAGKAISLPLIERLVHEYEELVADTRADEGYSDSPMRRNLLPDFGCLVRAVLCAEGAACERLSIFDRLLRLQRVGDDAASAFVPYLSQLGTDGTARLVSYAASTLRRTSESACVLLGLAPEFSATIFHKISLSPDAAYRTAAYRTLQKCVAVPNKLLLAAESALNDSDAGVRVWAAAALIRHCGRRPDAEAVLGWAVRRPENALRRWAMEGLADVAESVDAVDRNLAHLLRDTEEDVQLAALRRLQSSKVYSPTIVELIGNIWLGRVKADPLVRHEAFEYLAGAGPAGLSIAWQGLGGNSPRIHSQAIQLMGRLGPQAIEAAPALADYWQHGDPVHRESILRALGRLNAISQLVPLVTEVWESQDSELAAIAADMVHLFSIQDRRRLWPLVKNALSCRHRDVQSAAACSIRHFGMAVFEELAFLADSVDPFDRLGAVLGLKGLGRNHSTARSMVERAQVDVDLAVRMATVAGNT